MTRDVPARLAEIDLTDPTTFVEYDIHRMWRRFRTEQPVYWHPPAGRLPGFWVVSRHEDVRTVYRDGARFTSSRGNMLDTLLRGGDSAGGRMAPVADGPRHRKLRAALRDALAPRLLATLRPRLYERMANRVAELMDGGPFDFAKDVAERTPVITLCELLGLDPVTDGEWLVQRTQRMLSMNTAEVASVEAALLAKCEVLGLFADLTRKRRRTPGNDFVSTLVHAVVDGSPMTDDEIAYNCYSLIVGGEQSTRLTSTGAALALIEHPDQWRALREPETALDDAVEEVVRWITPGMHFARTVTTAGILGDQELGEGDIVTIWNTSANRDGDVFDRPDHFDLRRQPNPHVSFGYGAHYCMGASLGRLQLRTLLEVLRTTVDTIEQTGAALRIYSNFLFGYSSLPVNFSPVRSARSDLCPG